MDWSWRFPSILEEALKYAKTIQSLGLPDVLARVWRIGQTGFGVEASGCERRRDCQLRDQRPR